MEVRVIYLTARLVKVCRRRARLCLAAGRAGSAEELRLLLNFQLNDRFLLTLLLIGQPELRDRIGRIKQLEQRIAIKFHLGPLKLEETKAYINSRLEKAGGKRRIFQDEAVDAIHRASGGIPREINNICDICLLLGFGFQADAIDPDVVQKATQAVKQL